MTVEISATPVAHRAPSARPTAFPASFGQASLWFVRQVMPYKAAYNTSVKIRLEGPIDADALLAAVRDVARRHESLRTTFRLEAGAVEQLVWEDLAPDLGFVDASWSDEPGALVDAAARSLTRAPFDLAAGPLLRARLFRLAPKMHTLVFVIDHIVADGMSLGIVWREIGALYRARVVGEAADLPAPKAFTECVRAQNAWLETPAFARQLAAVVDKVRGAAPCDLPTDRPRPPVQSHEGGLVVAELDAELTARVRALAASVEGSLYAGLLAAMGALLARTTGQSDVLLMVPAASRQRFRAEQVVGFFANGMLLRLDVADALPFRDLVSRANRAIMGGIARQDVPFEKVVEALRPDRSLRQGAIANVSVSFLPPSASRLDLPGVRASFQPVESGGAKFDLYVVFAEHDGRVRASLEYNADIFDRATAAALLERTRVILEAATAAPETPVRALPLLTDEERRRVVDAWNDTAAPYPRDASLPSLVSAVAARSPQVGALSFEGQTMRYGELERRSNQLARVLAARGAGPGTRVGLAVERGAGMVVALYAILKTGAAYVPLDPSYPPARLAFMADDAKLRLLVTDDALRGLVPAPPRGTFCLDGGRAAIDAERDDPLDVAIAPESPAYVLYTSGSTGRPKGVVVPHRALVNFLTSMAKTPGLGATDRLLAVTSLSFDIAGLELWLPLTVGAHVAIASRATAADGAALLALLETGRVTVLQATPATFRLLLEAGWQGSRGLRVFVGGEATPPDLAEAMLDRADEVWNLYGPTETTVWSCAHRLAKGEPVLVGRPIANTRVYLLDRNRELVPPGAIGEAYIGGDGVALGYLDRPELTAERFVPDPFAPHEGARLYRTGDLARHRPGGVLEILGRADFQVKIRGNRIELGEIEAALAAHPDVREAVVTAWEPAPGEAALVAHVASAREDAALAADLRTHLRATLPEIMVPAHVVRLPALPRTQNGKIDRKALPPPTSAHEERALAADASPREAIEFKLRAIWEEVLRAPGIGIKDDFFDLGGHSLLALKLVDRIEKAFGQKLPVATIFVAPTVEAMADILRVRGWKPTWTSLVPIQPGGSKPPFFCVHGGGALVMFYVPLARRLGRDQPFYGLQPKALSVHDPDDPNVQSVEAMAAHYIDELREIQPKGPYLLGGASYGGMIALEMAQQLRAAGEATALLAMFDTHGPGYWTRPHGLRGLRLAPAHAYVRLEQHVEALRLLAPEERGAYVRSKLEKAIEEAEELVGDTARQAARRLFTRIGRPVPKDLEVVRNLVNEAVDRYVPAPYEGPITLFRADRQAPGLADDPTLGWAPIARGGLEIIPMPGYHAAMISEPRVRVLAPALAACIAKASAR